MGSMARDAMMLQIWRKGNCTSTSCNYEKVEDIELPSMSMCDGEFRALQDPEDRCRMQPNCVYGCTLKRKVKVEAEDILGVTLPPKNRARFILSFKNSTVSNYIFERNSPSNMRHTVNLSNYINETAVQPLIIVEVEPGIINYSYVATIIILLFLVLLQ